MGLRKALVVVLGLAAVGLFPCLCAAQSSLIGLGPLQVGSSLTSAPGVYLGVGLKKYVNSFISWEGEDRYGTDTAFRLEYPFDQWFGGFVATFVESTLAAKAEFWTNINTEIELLFQDSDWGPSFTRFFRLPTPSGKVFMTEATCSLHRGQLVDFCISLPAVARSLGVSPLFGCRFQSFDFRAYDRSTRSSIGFPPRFVPGDFVFMACKVA